MLLFVIVSIALFLEWRVFLADVFPMVVSVFSTTGQEASRLLVEAVDFVRLLRVVWWIVLPVVVGSGVVVSLLWKPMRASGAHVALAAMVSIQVSSTLVFLFLFLETLAALGTG